ERGGVGDGETVVYVGEEVGGYLVGGFEPQPKAWRLDDVPWEFTQQLLPADWELFEPLLAGAIRRVPAVEKAEILQLVNGPDGFTPDGHYALGPVPGRPGFWVAAGVAVNGLAGAGGVGRGVGGAVPGGGALAGRRGVELPPVGRLSRRPALRRREGAGGVPPLLRATISVRRERVGPTLPDEPAPRSAARTGSRLRRARGLGAGPLLRARAVRPAPGSRRAHLGPTELLGARGARAPRSARPR